MTTIRRGGTVVAALVTLVVVTILAATLLRSLIASHRRTRLYEREAQAQWLAEAAVELAAARLAAAPYYEGELWRPEGLNAEGAEGVAVIRVEAIADQPGAVRILVDAHFPDHPVQRASVRREATLARRAAQPPPAATRTENEP